MRVQVVGLGRVGRSFADFLRGRGVEVFTCRARGFEGKLVDADLLFLAVRDGYVSDVAREVYSRGREYGAVGHFSGVLTSDVLKPFPLRFSFHPLQAFARPSPDLWRGITVGFEGSEGAWLKVKPLTDLMGVRVVRVSKEEKAAYHAAAVLVSNLIYAPLMAGERVFARLGLSREDFAPLVRTSFLNFLRMGRGGLTGPLVRGDLETVKRHMETLSGEELELYRALTDYIKKAMEREHP